MKVIDPPGEYYGDSYYAVYFADPDGMKLEGMVFAPPKRKRSRKKKKINSDSSFRGAGILPRRTLRIAEPSLFAAARLTA